MSNIHTEYAARINTQRVQCTQQATIRFELSKFYCGFYDASFKTHMDFCLAKLILPKYCDALTKIIG